MLRWLQAYLNRRRFDRLFVAPFQPAISQARAKHARNDALRAQREHLHAALRR